MIRNTRNGILAVLAAIGLMGAATALHAQQTWTSRGPITTASLNGVAYGNGAFVAVEGYSTSGYARTSTDGASWNVSLGTTLPPLFGVAYGASKFVAAGGVQGGSGALWTSPNGSTWSSRSCPNCFYGVAWLNDQFVAVGESGTLFTSPDGTAWTQRNSGQTSWIKSAAWGNGVYVAVGSAGMVLTSPNAADWTRRTLGATGDFKGVAFGNGRFVAVSSMSPIQTSTNGTSWTPAAVGTSYDLKWVSFENGSFVAAGNYGVILVSTDGLDWTVPASPASQCLYGACASPAVFVAVGAGGAVLTAPVALPSAPVITLHPASQTVSAGDWVTLQSAATGTAPLFYQWRFNGTNLPGADGATLSLGAVTTGQAGVYSVQVSNTLFGAVVSSNALLTVLPVLSLGEALNAPYAVWTGGGDSLWTPQTALTHDGAAAARSGSIGNYGSTWIEAAASGPGPLSFWWRVSSEANYDFLRFYLDGVEQSRISGEAGWEEQRYSLGEGPHTLQWRYTKDSSLARGSDAGWVDQVSWTVTPGFCWSAESVQIDETAGTVTLEVRRLGGAAAPATVEFFTTNGSASAGSDYTATNGALEFPAGAATRQVSVALLDDSLAEGYETFWLALRNPSAGALILSPAALEIGLVDDEDSDGDGLPDAWERLHFGDIYSQNGDGDADWDGSDNAAELADGTDPNNPNSVKYSLSATPSPGGRILQEPLAQKYDRGTLVTLTAVPDEGLVFLGWTGDLTASTNPLQVSVTSSLAVRAEFGLDLGLALDATNLSWMIGGNGAWTGTPGGAHDGQDCAHSATTGYGDSWVETRLAGPGTLSFWWRIASADGLPGTPNDFGMFGLQVEGPSTSSNLFLGGPACEWQQASLPLGQGAFSVRWHYMPDTDFSGRFIGWLDQVLFRPDAPATNLLISGPALVGEASTNAYQCLAQLADGSQVDVTSLAAWSAAGRVPRGTAMDGAWLNAGYVRSNSPIAVQATYSFNNTSLSRSVPVLIQDLTNLPPVWTLQPAPSAIVGLPFDYLLQAEDPDGDPVLFSILSKPDWLSLVCTSWNGSLTSPITASAPGSVQGQDDETSPSALSQTPLDEGLLARPRAAAKAAGARLAASVQAGAFPEVTVYASVLDAAGQTVTGLGPSDFVVREQADTEASSTEETLTGFATNAMGLSFALVLDTSGSMAGERLAAAQAAALQFLARCSAPDRGSLVAFASADQVRVARPLDAVEADADANGTNDLAQAIWSLESLSRTALYDGTAAGLDTLAGAPGPKAVLVLSDGRSNDDARYNINSLLNKALAAGSPLYTIGLGSGADGSVLEQMASATGGRYYWAPSEEDLASVYARIGEDLRGRYTLTYTTHRPDFDGTTRTVTATAGGATGAATYRVDDPPRITLDESTRQLSEESQRPGESLLIRGIIRDRDAHLPGQSLWGFVYWRSADQLYSSSVSLILGATNQTAGEYPFTALIPASAADYPGVSYNLYVSDCILGNTLPENPSQWFFIPVSPVCRLAGTPGRTDAGPCDVMVQVTDGVTSVPRSISLVVTGLPPSILVQPSSRTVDAGYHTWNGCSLIVAGSPPMGFQWRLNGTNLPGMTSSNLPAPERITPQLAGDYSVVVTNAFGATVSSNAHLTVWTAPPTIYRPPADQTVVPGGRARLYVSASGIWPVTYQWRFNGQNVPGATSSMIEISPATPAQAGRYSVAVSNDFGGLVSSEALLSLVDIVGEPFRITALSTERSAIVDHESLTGGDWGGLAAGSSNVFVTGLSGSARFNASDLGTMAQTDGSAHELFSDLRSGAIYRLEHEFSGAGQVTALTELDGATLQPTGARIPLSLPIPYYPYATRGIFAGYGRVVLWDGQDVWNVALPWGVVTHAGVTYLNTPARTPDYACWGVAEFWDGVLSLVYARDARSIVRTRVTDAQTTVLAAFDDLGATACFSVIPALDRWFFHHPGQSQFGGDGQTLGSAAASFDYRRGPAAPLIVVQPAPQRTWVGQSAAFTVGVSGSAPLCYQWQHEGADVAGATGPTLSLTRLALPQAGLYSVLVSNAQGAVLSESVMLTLEEPGVDDFIISGLFTNNSRVIDHNSLTGDDRGGLALSSNRLFYSGDSATASFQLNDLSGATALGRVYDALASDLRTGTVYSLGNGATLIDSQGGLVTTLIQLNGTTLQPTGARLALSQPVAMTSGALFSGWGRIVLWTGGRALDISLATGGVAEAGPVNLPARQSSENWATWGVAEFWGGSLYLAYVRDSQTIVRTRVSDGQTTVVASFANLSDMACFTVDPARQRWYFHHEYASQFGGAYETLGYADASLVFRAGPPPPDRSLRLELAPALAGGPMFLSVRGPAGSNCVLLASTDLVSWTPLATNSLPASGLLTLPAPASPPAPQRFYRALQP